MKMPLKQAEKLRHGRCFSITINDVTYKGVLFEDLRITNIPKKCVAYGMRHPDDDWGVPETVCPNYPLVNFFGTFVTDKALPISGETEINGYSWRK